MSANGPVGVEWRPDAVLTREANIARWAGGRLNQIAEEQQRPLPTHWHRRVASCADGGEQLAAGTQTLGDVLSIAMSANACKKLVGDVLGTNQESAIKRVRGDILHVAKPVAEVKILRGALRFIRDDARRDGYTSSLGLEVQTAHASVTSLRTGGSAADTSGRVPALLLSMRSSSR